MESSVPAAGVCLADTLELPGVDGANAAPAGPPELGDRYEVLDLLGEGGMGAVYRVRDRELRRVVAVKVVRRAISADPAAIERFRDEARIAAQLEHPCIVTVHDVGTTPQEQPFFVMPHVDGRSLRSVLEGLRGGDPEAIERFTLRRLLAAFEQICRAVAFAHGRGVLHRDLKPENLMFGRFGEIAILDWGLAFAERLDVRTSGAISVAGDTSLAGFVVGTPGYMSPEQALGDASALTEASEVWSLGAILYELLTLAPAVGGSDPLQILANTVRGGIPMPRSVAPERPIAEDLEAVCMKALAHRTADRWADCSALADAIADVLDGTRRAALAAAHLAEAEEQWQLCVRRSEELAAAERAERTLRAHTPRHRPLAEKVALVDAVAAVERLRVDVAERFAEAVARGERALSVDPGNANARALLARVYADRLLDAEARGDRALEAFYARRVRSFDDGAWADVLDGQRRLSLTTEPAGAEAVALPIHRAGLVWTHGAPVPLGPTPLDGAALPAGAYIVQLRHGALEARVSVDLRRGHDVSLPVVRLLDPAAVTARWTHVPAGPYRSGADPRATGAGPAEERLLDGFLIQTHPVTVAEWIAFLNALHLHDPETAWSRTPRLAAADGEPKRYFERPGPEGRYTAPEVDRDGDAWDVRWPVVGISWDDAVAYAAWRTEQTGVPHRLPSEWEWEKAARGADGRSYPWGHEFDNALCNAGGSVFPRPTPLPVTSFEHDCSPYGVRDLAGGVSEWCAETRTCSDGREERAVRGGGWMSGPDACRLAKRVFKDPTVVLTSMGVRLVRPLPGHAGQAG